MAMQALTVVGAAPHQPRAGVEAGFGAQAVEAIGHDCAGPRPKERARQRPYAPIGQAQAAAHDCGCRAVPVIVAAARRSTAYRQHGGHILACMGCVMCESQTMTGG